MAARCFLRCIVVPQSRLTVRGPQVPGLTLVRCWCRLRSSVVEGRTSLVTTRTDSPDESFTLLPRGIPADKDEILNEINNVLYGKPANIQARHGIHSRLETLESVGCSLDDIHNNPDVLLLTEVQVFKAVQKLRKWHLDVNVESVKIAHLRSRGAFQKLVQNHQKKERFEIAKLLQCSVEDCETLGKQYPFLKSETAERLAPKIDYLLSTGITLDEVRENCFILKRKLDDLAEVAAGIQKIQCGKVGMFDKESKDLFLDTEKLLLYAREKTDKKQQRCEHVARLLQVDISQLDVKYCAVPLKTVLQKIVFLLDQGINKKDLLNHLYLMQISLSTLQRTVQTAHNVGLTKFTAMSLINILQHRTISPKPGKARHHNFVARQLDLPKTVFSNLGPRSNLVFSRDKAILKANIDYLKGNGFSSRDIHDCVLIIGHDPDVLKSYLESLSERLEVQPYEIADNVVVLNAVQYFIERDGNFNCKEQLSDVKEYVAPGCMADPHEEDLS
ncbi:uncharacterized protein LOC124144706 [Haliotis rufescens]|uniref:uncharacterized protein LOC124144706 n=1 Tax=Haliotis rufescens TaxID=6454 RepID=UPI00201F64E6|nr:uncharacterized protein LOC124144706 [Haliotis rufescens]